MKIDDAKTNTGKACIIICKAVFMICKFSIMAIIGTYKILKKLDKHMPPPTKNLYSCYGEAESMRQSGLADLYEHSKTIC